MAEIREPAPRLLNLFVCRVAGIPAHAVEDLRLDRSLAVIREMFHLEDTLLRSRDEISRKLHELIGSHPCRKSQKHLISLRRDLYNLRPVKSSRLSALSVDLRETVRDFLALQEKHGRTLEHFEATFQKESQLRRRLFQDELRDGDFQKALLLSSRSLWHAREKYASFGESELRARERQIERGLVKYLTRMSMKATPFATFCAVLPGSIVAPDASSGPPLRFQGNPLLKRVHVRLNKAFYAILSSHLPQHPEIRRQFYIKSNPTIRKEGESELRFLTSVQGRETFQRITFNPALEMILAMLEPGKQLHTMQQLTRDLQRVAGTSEEHAEVYVDRLLGIGFLRLTTGIPSQDLDWLEKFSSFLARIPHELARESVDLLRSLDGMAREYECAQLDQRAILLDRIDSCFDTFCTKWGVKLRARAPLYEDATGDRNAAATLTWSDGMRSIERSLVEYVTLTSKVSTLRRDMANMRHFFDKFYEERSVPLLRFYEDYYREHYKEHLERDAKIRRGDLRDPDDHYSMSNPFGLDFIDRLLSARRELVSFIVERWSSEDPVATINLTAADLRNILRNVEEQPTAGWSVALYCDLVVPPKEGDATQLVVHYGGYVTGFGKTFSRFLHLFPDRFGDELRQNNSSLSSYSLAELCDDGNFNANLHPPLLGQEISYPMGESRGGKGEVLPSDLMVLPDPLDPNSLVLLHVQTGNRISPVDTGFINAIARPPLYRFLSSFTPGASFRLPLPDVTTFGRQTPAVAQRPRITFDERIVIHRRSWLVPSALYPKRASQESDAKYFLRVTRWRLEHDMPEEVYVSFLPYKNLSADIPRSRSASTEKSRVDLDSQKPQYVDFGNSLLVRLFGHMAPEQESFMAVLEERIPGRESLASYQGNRLVTELVLQLDFPVRT